MQFYFQQGLRALILLSFTIYIVYLHYSGEILKYINPKYDTISQIGAIIFLILFVAQLQRVWTMKSTNVEHHHDHCDDHDHCGHNHDHGYSRFNAKKLVSYLIIAFPLITGFVLPPSNLDASIAAKKGGMLSITSNSESNELNGKEVIDSDEQREVPLESDDEQLVPSPSVDEVPGHLESDVSDEDIATNDQRDPNLDSNTVTQEEYDKLLNDLENTSIIDMSDDVYYTYYEIINTDLEKYEGREITLNGFVYKENGFKENQLVLGRFLITHCVADASIVGFLSEFDEASGIAMDTWLEAKGTIELQEYNGTMLPTVIVSEWKTIDEPKQPYLYPLSIKIR